MIDQLLVENTALPIWAIRIPLSMLAMACLLSPILLASDGGSLLGTVTDPAGAAIPGARVEATETSTTIKQTISTDDRGFYSFQSLPVGRYDLQVNASGFK